MTNQLEIATLPLREAVVPYSGSAQGGIRTTLKALLEERGLPGKVGQELLHIMRQCLCFLGKIDPKYGLPENAMKVSGKG